MGALPTTNTESNRMPPRLVLIARNKLLHQLTRSPQFDKRALRLLLPREYNHLLGQSQSSASGFSNPRRVAS